jgi:formylmethanofuran dehydrogenase subunit E
MLEETQTSKDRKRKSSSFDIKPVNEFISDKSKKEFGHICDQCGKKYQCQKTKNSIILNCKEFEQKIYKQNNNNFKKRKR